MRCEDINETLADERSQYDIIVTNSFLHHIPDYAGLIQRTIGLLSSQGIFFSFQDPLRYDSMKRLPMMFSMASYFWWRAFKGDAIGGLRRRLRRRRGIYLEGSVHDNAEYHVTRNGVDQDAIRTIFEKKGFDCRIIRYFSTQSRLFQPIGTLIGVKNTFAVIAKKS